MTVGLVLMTQLRADTDLPVLWLWMFITGIGHRADAVGLHDRRPERGPVPQARGRDEQPDLLPPDRRLDRAGDRRDGLRDPASRGAADAADRRRPSPAGRGPVRRPGPRGVRQPRRRRGRSRGADPGRRPGSLPARGRAAHPGHRQRDPRVVQHRRLGLVPDRRGDDGARAGGRVRDARAAVARVVMGRRRTRPRSVPPGREGRRRRWRARQLTTKTERGGVSSGRGVIAATIAVWR